MELYARSETSICSWMPSARSWTKESICPVSHVCEHFLVHVEVKKLALRDRLIGHVWLRIQLTFFSLAWWSIPSIVHRNGPQKFGAVVSLLVYFGRMLSRVEESMPSKVPAGNENLEPRSTSRQCPRFCLPWVLRAYCSDSDQVMVSMCSLQPPKGNLSCPCRGKVIFHPVSVASKVRRACA